MYVHSSSRGLIKGNINSKGEKIYHIPGDPWYNKTKAEVWFKKKQKHKQQGLDHQKGKLISLVF
ncbi:sunset domain-containing protein [Thermoanaerobacter ethanolicus]